MRNYVIILAAGLGNRFMGKSPKQFLLLGEKPILMHTISIFHCSQVAPEIVVVLHPDYIDYWKRLCKTHNFFVPHKIIEGGKERFHSVKNALDILPDEGYVGIHDSVRPFVTEKVICLSYLTARTLGNAIPAVPATNTIRYFDGSKTSTSLDRNHIYVVQNPQVFKLQQIKAAYIQPYHPSFTDDAIVAENYGMEINLVEGDQRNIKITHPTDIEIANGILKYNSTVLF